MGLQAITAAVLCIPSAGGISSTVGIQIDKAAQRPLYGPAKASLAPLDAKAQLYQLCSMPFILPWTLPRNPKARHPGHR